MKTGFMIGSAGGTHRKCGSRREHPAALVGEYTFNAVDGGTDLIDSNTVRGDRGFTLRHEYAHAGHQRGEFIEKACRYVKAVRQGRCPGISTFDLIDASG